MEYYLNVQTPALNTHTARTIEMKGLKYVHEWCYSTASNRWNVLSTRIPLNTFQASRYPSYAVHMLAQNGHTQRIRPSLVERAVKGTFIRNKSVIVLSIHYRQQQNHMLGL
jgi:hypothetical protein